MSNNTDTWKRKIEETAANMRERLTDAVHKYDPHSSHKDAEDTPLSRDEQKEVMKDPALMEAESATPEPRATVVLPAESMDELDEPVGLRETTDTMEAVPPPLTKNGDMTSKEATHE